MKKIKKVIAAVLFSVSMLSMASSAWAFNAPANSDLFYWLYDLVVVKIGLGAAMYTLAFGCLVWAVIAAIRSKYGQAAGAVIGIAGFALAPTILTAFGATF